MEFLDHREWGMVSYQDLYLSPLQCTVTELYKYIRCCVSLKNSQGKALEMTVNCKEENSEDFCLDFVQEFGL